MATVTVRQRRRRQTGCIGQSRRSSATRRPATKKRPAAGKKRAATKRRAARNRSATRKQRLARTRAAARASLQLVVLVAGGAVAGGLALLAAIPSVTELPRALPLAGCVVTVAGTFVAARRLQPRR